MLLTYLERFITEERKERFREIIGQRTNHFTVAMEDVFQMHNTSAVVRTSEVFGVQQAHSIEGRFGKRLDAKIVATTPHKDAYFLNDFDISKKSAFFFGTEKEGLSEQVLSQADTFLKIPMVGFTESLNISVAVAIVLQQLTDRLRRSDLRWQLTEEERYDTLVHWTKQSIRNVNDVLKRYEEIKDTL